MLVSKIRSNKITYTNLDPPFNMNKESNLNDKEIAKPLGAIDNNFTLDKSRQEIKFVVVEKTGRLWPYHGDKKALVLALLPRF